MGFAPALKGFERVAGRWYMIVMGAITDEFSLVDRPSSSLYEPIKEKVAALHQQGYVHGDLRDTNLMVRKNGAPGVICPRNGGPSPSQVHLVPLFEPCGLHIYFLMP